MLFAPHDPSVNLASTAMSGDIFHQPGSCYVKGKFNFCNFLYVCYHFGLLWILILVFNPKLVILGFVTLTSSIARPSHNYLSAGTQ